MMLPLLWVALLVLAGLLPGGPVVLAQEMLLDDVLDTCDTFERPQLEKAFPDAVGDFLGKVTVLFNVAPPKPIQTQAVFNSRDPIHYYNIDYREQIKLYHNLYRMFHRTDAFRNGVRFLLSASLHREPYEVRQYNFTEFFDAVQTVANEYNFTVYPNYLGENRTLSLFGLREFQVYVMDRCSRLAYTIKPPWSLLQYAYIKAAVLSTFYDRPCGVCENENFLNSTVLDDENQSGFRETGASSANIPAKPYEDDSDETAGKGETDGSSSEEYDGGNGDMPILLTDDPFPNLTVSGPDLELPLRVTLPVLHIHVDVQSTGEDSKGGNNTPNAYKLHHYMELHSNGTEHHTHPKDSAPRDDVQLVDLHLDLNSSQASGTNQSEQHHDVLVRIHGTKWPATQLREILNSSTVLYDPVHERVFERFKRYNISDGQQFDEISEVSVAERYILWHRRKFPPAATRNNRRSQLKKHYARLIPWLHWTFGKPIPSQLQGQL